LAKLNYPFGVAVDSNDNVYIADRSNHVIRKIDTDHMISTIAGNGSLGYSGDGGLATSAQLNNPWGVAVDSSGNIYIADSDNNVVRKVDPDGNISTFAGNGTEGSGGDGGPAASAQLGHPTGLAIDSKGNLYIANVYNAMVRKVDPDGNISTVFKGGVSGTFAAGVAVDSNDNLYIAWADGGYIVKIDTDGVQSVFAGIPGTKYYTGDGGPATEARLNEPHAVAVDSAGNVYIADTYNHRIRKVDLDGNISTVAGNGVKTKDKASEGIGGPATSASISEVRGLAIDSKGNLYMADFWGSIKYLNLDGIERSGDASLSSLTLSSGTLRERDSGSSEFSPDKTFYQWYAPSDASLTITPTSSNSGAVIQVDDKYLPNGTESEVIDGKYVIINLMAENGVTYSQYRVDIFRTFTVNFDSGGGSHVADLTDVAEGKKIIEPAAPTKAGYTFEGWYKEASYDTLWNFGADTVTEDTTLYAKWEAKPAATYTVSFDTDGGSSVADLTDVVVGTTITVPATPTKVGYTFEGWYKEASYDTLWNFGADTVTGDTTLYAKWEAIPAATYTVSFDTDGGSSVADLTGVSEGATITGPVTPTKAGYTFEGWYKEASHDTLWNFSADTVTGDTTLYAKWEAILAATYTVSFDADGGSSVADLTGVSEGATITEPVTPTKAGYTFEGWYKEASHDTLWNFSADTVTGDTTLYAKWTAATGGSSGGSDGDGGSGPIAPDDSKVISDNGELTLPAGEPGEVSLDGDKITIEIPADVANEDLKLTIEKWLDTQSLLSDKEVLLSDVFEILKNFKENFKKPVKLTFAFNQTKLSGDEHPSIFYYDEAKKVWIEVGGVVDGNFITAEVDHFTKFAVLAVSQSDDEPKPAVFSDIAGHWAEDVIEHAVSEGIVSGYPDGTFRPNDTVTRAEFAVMLTSALKLTGEGSALTFTDAAKIPSWARKAVQQAVQAGMISGYEDGTFRPEAQITRSEMAVMIAAALKLDIKASDTTGFADDESIPSWSKGAIAKLRELDLMVGYGGNRFNPAAHATRAEAVTILMGMLER